jgi:hypothetical protein
MQSGRDLGSELRDLGPSVEYPPTPDLARSVRGRGRRNGGERWRRVGARGSGRRVGADAAPTGYGIRSHFFRRRWLFGECLLPA